MGPLFNQQITRIQPSASALSPVENTLADLRQSSTDAITAHAGGGQANATALTTVVNRITVVVTAADSVRLPAAKAGMEAFVINSDAADSLNVFPASGETINSVAADGAFALAANARNHFVCPVDGKWYTFPLVNS